MVLLGLEGYSLLFGVLVGLLVMIAALIKIDIGRFRRGDQQGSE